MKRTAPKLTERQIEKQIDDLLKVHGWSVTRMNRFFSGNAVVVQGAVEPGIPDLQVRKKLTEYRTTSGSLSFIAGYLLVWIEVKRPGEELSPAQEKWHLLARKRGETVIVCESVEQAAEAFGIRL